MVAAKKITFGLKWTIPKGGQKDTIQIDFKFFFLLSIELNQKKNQLVFHCYSNIVSEPLTIIIEYLNWHESNTYARELFVIGSQWIDNVSGVCVHFVCKTDTDQANTRNEQRQKKKKKTCMGTYSIVHR